MNTISEKYRNQLSCMLSYRCQCNTKTSKKELRSATSKLLSSISKGNNVTEKEINGYSNIELADLFRKSQRCPYQLEKIKGMEMKPFYRNLIDIANRDYNGDDHDVHFSEVEVLYIVEHI